MQATTDINGGCTLSFEGTSSASPLAAGGFALVLQAKLEMAYPNDRRILIHCGGVFYTVHTLFSCI